MQSLAVAKTTGEVTSRPLGDAVQSVEVLGTSMREMVQPLSESVTRFAEQMRKNLQDPRNVYELVLYRLRSRAAAALDAITTRRGRDYLHDKDSQDTNESAAVSVAALSLIRPRWHQRTTERVTCLQAPRAQLAKAAA
jgi:hypothetical protein